MDDLELIKRFYPEPPETDEVARARALERLRAGSRSRGRRVTATVVGVSAALLALGLTFGVLVLRPGLSAAQRELLELARSAGAHELAAGDRPVVYERTRSFEPDSFERLPTGETFTVEVRRVTEIWRSADGGVFHVRRVLSLSFPSERDRARWAEARAEGLDVPEVGEVVQEEIPAGQLPLPQLSGLSLDPGELLDQLRGDWWPDPLENDAATLEAIAELLARGDARPELRAALFRAASTLDGVELLGEMDDPLRRRGVALAAGPDHDLVIVVDPQTSRLLSIEERLGPLTTWRAFTDWATVDTPGERPAESLH